MRLRPETAATRFTCRTCGWRRRSSEARTLHDDLARCRSRAARGLLLHENVDDDRYRGVGFIDPRLSVATLVRLLLPDLFAGHYDSLLYLDCDLTIHADVSQLFRLDIGACPVAAQRRGVLFLTPLLAEEAAAHFARLKMTRPVRYCNTGVMLIDVEQGVTIRTQSGLRPAR